MTTSSASVYVLCKVFFIVHEYGSLGQAIFDECLAGVKCDESVN